MNNQITTIMKKKLLYYILILSFSVTISAQNRKGELYLTPGSNQHELYVSFLTSVQFDTSDYLNVLLRSVPEIKSINDQFHPQFEKGIAISDEKLNFMESEAIRISKNGASVRKLRNILKVKIENPTNERLLDLATKLEQLKEVDYCSLMSLTPIAPPGDIPPVTTNYEPAQTYIGANPGVNMSYAWGLGLTGSGMRVRDCEYGFNKSHEELVDGNVFLAPGMTISTSATTAYTEHGTAVLGIIYANKGAYGISGMAYGAQEVVQFPEWQQTGYDRLYAITQAIGNSVAGDVVIYEMQTGGQSGNYVPTEYTQAIWDATKAATDAGIIVVAAAGNGNENLDAAFYLSYRNRGDSGAIIVGAGSADVGHNKLSFSTYGARVDVQGWGGGVRATGYGDYIAVGGDFNQNYTTFSGTSSATPIVASCAIVLQSYYHGLTGNYLTSVQMRNLLKTTGIAQGTGGNIGPLPNMQTAIAQVNVLSVQENSNLVVFNVYPNPTKDIITISTQEDLSGNAKVEITNAIGQQVYASNISVGNNDISVADFQSGLYFVKVINGGKSSVRKIIKQ